MLLSWLHAVVAGPPAYGSLVLCGPALQLCFVSPPFGIMRKIIILSNCAVFASLRCHLVVHCIALLMPPTTLISSSVLFSSLLMHPLLPHQLLPLLLHHRDLSTFWSVSSCGCSFVAASQRVDAFVYTFPFVGLFCCCPVLNPFVWQPYEPIPAITA